MLLLSCVQSAFVNRLRGSVREADYARLANEDIGLASLHWPEAESLVRARLDSRHELKRARQGQRDSLWPLSSGSLGAFAGGMGCTARGLLNRCKADFELWQRGTVAPRPLLDDFLGRRYDELVEQALQGSDPHRGEDGLAHGLPLVMEVVQQGRLDSTAKIRDMEIVFDGAGGRMHVSLCNQSHNALTNRLKRIRERVEKGQLDNVAVLRDSRLPIPKTSRVAREQWDAWSVSARRRRNIVACEWSARGWRPWRRSTPFGGSFRMPKRAILPIRVRPWAPEPFRSGWQPIFPRASSISLERSFRAARTLVRTSYWRICFPSFKSGGWPVLRKRLNRCTKNQWRSKPVAAPSRPFWRPSGASQGSVRMDSGSPRGRRTSIGN